jgi:peroxiredoxin
MADRPNQTSKEIVPDFSLPASTGHTLQLESFLGRSSMVFVFLDYQSERDRRLLDEINSRLKEFGAQRAQMLVIMRLSARDTSQMAEELDLAVPVLADANGAMARDYGAESSEQGGHSVAVVTDEQGVVVRRFAPLDEHAGAAETVDALLGALDRGESREISVEPDPIGSDEEFYARIADEARIPAGEAPVLVRAFLEAVAPSLGEDARAVVSELAPGGLVVPTARDSDAGVESLLLAALEESSIATGRPAEHARVVAEALRSRANETQLRRLEAAVDDEDVLSLFESERGELTAHHRMAGVSELSGDEAEHEASRANSRANSLSDSH